MYPIVRSADEGVDTKWKDIYPVFLFNAGFLLWSVEGKFRSSCSLDMFKFPFDTQYCSLDFGNVVHFDMSVNLSAVLEFIDQEFYVPSKEFE